MSQLGFTEVMNFTLATYNRNIFKRLPILSCDYAQVTGLSGGADRQTVVGGQGSRVLLTKDNAKTSQITATLPLIDLKMLAEITGDRATEEIKKLFIREEKVIQDGDNGEKFILLDRAPIKNSIHLYNLDNCSDIGTKICPALTEGSVQLEEGQYTIDETNPKKLILHKDHAPATNTMIIYYHYETAKKVANLVINSDTFPRTISFYGDLLVQDSCTGEDRIYRLVGHKGRIQPNYEISMSATDPAVLEIVIDMESFKDPETQKNIYIEFIEDDIQPEGVKPEGDPCEIDDDGNTGE